MQVSEPAMVVNLDNLQTKRRLMSKIGSMKGVWEITLRQKKKRRSLNANSYYWSAFIPGWLEWLRENTGEPWITAEQAHEALVARVLGTKPIVNKETGEIIDEVRPRTSQMDSTEFGQYLDRAAEFLASFCSIVVLPPEVYFDERDRGYDNRNSNKRSSIAA